MHARLLLYQVLWVAVFAFLASLSSPAHAVTIDWVAVGDPGNAADTMGFGSVATPYRISKFEITTAQYAEFLNAVAVTDSNGLYNTTMGVGAGAGILRSGSSGSFVYTVASGRGNKPVHFVSFFDAARFANWLHNGQPTGAQDDTTTEDGAYRVPATSVQFTRRLGARVFLPSEDEWYKAAYYDPGTSSYFSSPLSTNANPLCAPPGPAPNMANCSGLGGGLSDVGAYTGSPSPSGTFDQGGNLAEWSETLNSGTSRVRRGGDSGDFAFRLFSSSRFLTSQTSELFNIGFRVAAGPEPGVPAQDFFTIDPAQSFVQIASTSVFTLDFLGVVMALDLPLQSQVGVGGTGLLSDGLRTNLSGYLLVDIPVGGGVPTLEIIDRRSSIFLADSGVWLPGVPGSPAIAAPAALAAVLESTAFAVSISAAVRGAEFSAGHGGLPEMLTDLGGGLFTFPLGYMGTGLVAIPVNGVTDRAAFVGGLETLGSGRSSLALSVADVPSQLIGQATLLEQPGGGRMLTLPIDITVVLTDDTFAAGLPVSISLDLTGQVVATNALFVPEPAPAMAWLAALGTLAALRRSRRS